MGSYAPCESVFRQTEVVLYMFVPAMFSVVPERIQWTIVHELVHILGERELNVLYFCLVNVFILAFVNGAPSQFNFVQESSTFP